MTTKLICVLNNNVPADSSLRSEHGLSIWIENEQGVLLFDTGLSGSVLSHNLDALGLPKNRITALALSHAHLDHTGGLKIFLDMENKIPLYANTDLFTQRFSYRDDQYRDVGIPYKEAELSKHFMLHLQDDPVKLLPNLWTTGKISNRPEKEGGSIHLYIQQQDQFLPDPYADDMSLVLKTGHELVLICGCCHAGLLNTLMHVEETFQQKVKMVIGGSHLVSFDNDDLDHVIKIIQQQYPNCQFLLNHCTGAKAIERMQQKLENQVQEFLPGTWLEFE